MTKDSKKYIFWVVLALVIIGAGVYYWWSQKPPGNKEEEKPPVIPNTNMNTNPSSSAGGNNPVWSECLSETNAWNKFWDYQKETFFRNQTLSLANRSRNKCQTALLQTILNKQAGAKLTVDGDYGSKTEAAVMAVFNKKTINLNYVDQKYKITKLYGGSAGVSNIPSWLK